MSLLLIFIKRVLLNFDSDKGFTLISAVAGTAVASVALLGIAGSSGLLMKSIRSIEMRGELEDMRNLIRTSLDCTATISDGIEDCENETFVEGRRKDGTKLFAKYSDEVTRYGNSSYGVRATCSKQEDHYTLNIEYDRELKDPATGRVRGWGDLFAGIPWECTDNLNDRSCDEDQVQSMNVILNFKETVTEYNGCAWGQDGNPERFDINRRIMATREQDQVINLPSDSVICSIALQSETQSFSFDDWFLITFEDFILASSNYDYQTFEGWGLERVGSLLKYRKGILLDPLYTPPSYFHSQCPEGGTCDITPASNNAWVFTTGPVNIYVPPSWMELLPDESRMKNKLKMTLILTGNGNAITDCQHSGLKMNVEIKYQ